MMPCPECGTAGGHTIDCPTLGGGGVKHDADKPRWSLLPWRAAEAIVRVLTFGARKYDDDNWRHVPDARRRYFDATMRHMVAWQRGDTADDETGEHPLTHAATCLMFIVELEHEERNR
jgi:hypothetical protein